MSMFEDRSAEQADNTLDPMEAMLAYKQGTNAQPWHPATMPAPYVYKVTFLGAMGVGKSALARRLVAHTFDPTHRPTRQPEQLFWRHTEAATGLDILMEIEDTPGVTPDTTESGELKPVGRSELERLLFPLVWFEKRRKDTDGFRAPVAEEKSPLLPGAKVSSRAKAKAESGGNNSLMKSMGENLGAVANGAMGGKQSGKPNPIGVDRKRMGFIIVADVSDRKSFDVAYAIVDNIFGRLQFDVSDPMTCPVAMVIVGNKSDMRGNKRQVDSKEVLKAEIQRKYSPKNEPRFSVEYIECSAQTNTTENMETSKTTEPNRGLDLVMLAALNRIRGLPSRSRIRTARMRATGFFAKFKQELYGCLPFLLDVEECCKFTLRGVLKPCFKRLGLYAVFCECAPCRRVNRFFASLLATFLTFRWLCDWCPPFILRLRQDITAEEEDADIEGGGGNNEGDDEP